MREHEWGKCVEGMRRGKREYKARGTDVRPPTIGISRQPDCHKIFESRLWQGLIKLLTMQLPVATSSQLSVQ